MTTNENHDPRDDREFPGSPAPFGEQEPGRGGLRDDGGLRCDGDLPADDDAWPIGSLADADDPRLTAYALGELDGEARRDDRLAVERFLAAHPEARAELDALTDLADVLGTELASEAPLALDAGRRHVLEHALELGGVEQGGAGPAIAWRSWLSAAAALMLAVLVTWEVLAPDGIGGHARSVDAPLVFVRPPAQQWADPGEPDALKELGYLAKGETRGQFAKDQREQGALGAALDAGAASGASGASGVPARDDDAVDSRYAPAVAGAVQPDRYAAGDDGEAASPAGAPVGSGLADGPSASVAVGDKKAAFRSALVEPEFDSAAPPISESLVTAAESSLPTSTQAPPATIDAEALLQLKALGYLDSSEAGATRRGAGRGPAAGRAGAATAGQGAAPAATTPTARDSLRAELVSKVAEPAAEATLRRMVNPSASPGLLTGRGKALLDADRDAERASRDFFRPQPSGESYADVVENPFVRLTGDALSALSTFGLDVDTASYSNVRRMLHRNEAPPPSSVRLEELVNAFRYDDPAPTDGRALAAHVEAASCPWAPEHRIVRIGIKGRELTAAQRPPSNLVFLLDVSGSMKDTDKLPLLVQSLELLLDGLRDDDRVAIVTYASGTQVVLPSTPCAERSTILAALRGLSAGGSTNASAGIELAYAQATAAFLDEGNNRVLLATDGDFNVGVTDHDGLQRLITEKAAGGIFLTVLGFGTGNLKDDTAELLADKGNGNYAYIDSLDEAHRVLVRELQGTLHVIAKDAKVQVEFNPGKVSAYRLLGYENRALAATDFRDDKKDAGEVGAGHSLTVLYEVVPVGAPAVGGTSDLRYQQVPDPATFVDSPELLTVNLRWLPPEGGAAAEVAVPFVDEGGAFEQASADLRFASAVAAFGMLLKGSRYCGEADLGAIADQAEQAKGPDPDGRRAELVRLVRTARGVLRR